MSRSEFEINEWVLKAIQELVHSPFTLDDAVSKYLKLSNADAKLARRIVYRQLYRLNKHGLISQVSKQGKKVVYAVTDNFANTGFILKSAGAQSITDPEQNDADFIEKLKHKKSLYEVEMLTALGEAEELQALINEFPNNTGLLMPKYKQARKHTSTLLGRINAIESTLSSAQQAS